jgi:hypothetical protein
MERSQIADETLSLSIHQRLVKHCLPCGKEGGIVCSRHLRQIAHYVYHCGQIVLLAKHFNHGGWKSLSVPRGESQEFSRRVRAGSSAKR